VVSTGTGTAPRLTELARLQAGVISRHQALSCGSTRDAVRWAVQKGAWQRVCPGVYATFTGQVGQRARLWAVLLHAGEGAILSHETAAELLGLTDQAPARIHVTVPNARRVVAPPGVLIHISRRTYPKWRYARGIPPHTMSEDTVIDLVNAASTLDDAAGWVTAAFARRVTGEWPLRQAIAERSRLRWREHLDEMITLAASGAHSALEFRYDRDVERAHGLPRAVRQASFVNGDGSRGFRDRYYEQYGRLVVELDGALYHAGETRGQDRLRDNQAAALGGSTLRYDWTSVTRRACETAAEVFAALGKRGYQGALTPCSPACRAVAAAGRMPAGGWRDGGAAT
jgi:predicted transcriptional regulator of viral defense system